MVVCDSPVASATWVSPPRPIARASTAAQRRRVRSSKSGASTANLALMACIIEFCIVQMITDQPCTETDYFGEPPESRRHVSFTNLVYDPTRWQHERDDAYTELQLPQEPDDFCAR